MEKNYDNVDSRLDLPRHIFCHFPSNHSPSIQINATVEEIAENYNQLPNELQEKIMTMFVSSAEHCLIQQLRCEGRSCQAWTIIGPKYWVLLKNNDEIKEFIQLSDEFYIPDWVRRGSIVKQRPDGNDKSFHLSRRKISFGGIAVLDFTVPEDPVLARELGRVIFESGIKQINMYAQFPDFVASLQGPAWDAVFAKINFLRIKYDVGLDMVSPDLALFLQRAD